MNKELKITLKVDAKTGAIVSTADSFSALDKRVSKSTLSIDDFNKSLLALGGIATTAILSIGKIEESFKSLESAELAVKKTTGLTGKDLKQLISTLDTMSVSMSGFEITGLYNIAETAGQLGITGVDNLEKFTKEMQYMASSSKLTAEESATSFAEIANVLDLDISQINKLTASFTKLASSTTADERWLADSMQRIAGAGHEIGIADAELVAISATMKNVGLNVEVSGTAISEVFAKMAKESNKFAIVAGVSFSEFDSMMRDKPVKALEAFLTGLDKLDTKTKFQTLDALTLGAMGTSSTLLKLSSNVKDLEKNILTSSRAYEIGNATEKEYAVSAESLAQQQMRATSAIKLAEKALGEELKPTLLEINELVIDGANYITENKEALLDIAKALGIATSAGLAFNLMMRATPWGMAIAGATALIGVLSNLYITEQRRAKLHDEINAKIKAGTHSYNSYGQLEENSKIRLDTYNAKLKEQKILKQSIEAINKNSYISDEIKYKKLTEMGKEYNNISLQVKVLENTYKSELVISKKHTAEVKKANSLIIKGSSGVLSKLKELDSAKRNSRKLTTKRVKALSDEDKEAKKFLNERIAKEKEFAELYNKSFLSNYEYEKKLLNEKKAEYKKYGIDKLKLDKWYQLEVQKLDKENQESAIELQEQSLAIKRKEIELSSGKQDTLLKLKDEIFILEKKLLLEKDIEKHQALELEILNRKIDINSELKRVEKERLSKILDAKTKEVQERKRQEKLYSEWYEKELAKRAKPYQDLTKSITDNTLKGDFTFESLDRVLDKFRKDSAPQLGDILSDKVKEGFDKGFENIDWSLIDKDGNLTDLSKGLMSMTGQIGKKFAMGNTADDQAAESFGKEAGSVAGTAIGSYFGSPELGDAIGTAVGGALGRGFGGTKSKYIDFDNSNSQVVQRTSGGQWRKDKYKVLENETDDFLDYWDRTTQLYSYLYEEMDISFNEFKIDEGKYNTKELTEEIIPKEFLSDLAGLPKTITEEIESYTYDYESGSLKAVVSTIEKDNPELDKLYDSWKDYAKEMGTTVNQALYDGLSNVEQAQYNIDLYKAKDDIYRTNQIELDQLKDKKKQYEDILGVENTSIDNFDELSDSILHSSDITPEAINALNGLSQTLLESASITDDYNKSMQSMNNTFIDSLNRLKQSTLDIDNSSELEKLETRKNLALAAIGMSTNTTADELISAANNMEQVSRTMAGSDMYSPTIDGAKWTNAINTLAAYNEALRDNKSVTETAVTSTNNITSSIEQLLYSSRKLEDFIDWRKKWDMTDLEQLQYDMDSYRANQADILSKMGVDWMSATDYITQYNEALKGGLTKDDVDLWDELGDNITSIWEAQQKYNEALEEQRNKLEDFKDWDNSFGLDGLDLATYNLNKASNDLADALDADGFTLDTITPEQYIEHLNNAIEDGFRKASIDDWEALGDALKDATEAEKAYNEALQDIYNSKVDEYSSIDNTYLSYKNELDDLLEKQAQTELDNAQAELDYIDEVSKKTKDMYDGAIDKIDELLFKLYGFNDDSSLGMYENLIEYNKQVNNVDSAIASGTITEDKFNQYIDDISTYGNNIYSNDLFSDSIRLPMIDTLEDLNAKFSDSDSLAKVEVDATELESLTTEEIARINELKDLTKYYGDMMLDSDIVIGIDNTLVDGFSESSKLSKDQYIELLQITEDGVITNQELSNLKHLSYEQVLSFSNLDGNLINGFTDVTSILDKILSGILNFSIPTTTTTSSHTSYTSFEITDGTGKVVGEGGGIDMSVFPNESYSFYADGGYTGSGSKYDVAGIVHAGEYVLTQSETQQLGLNHSVSFKDILKKPINISLNTNSNTKVVNEIRAVKDFIKQLLNKLDEGIALDKQLVIENKKLQYLVEEGL